MPERMTFFRIMQLVNVSFAYDIMEKKKKRLFFKFLLKFISFVKKKDEVSWKMKKINKSEFS